VEATRARLLARIDHALDDDVGCNARPRAVYSHARALRYALARARASVTLISRVGEAGLGSKFAFSIRSGQNFLKPAASHLARTCFVRVLLNHSLHEELSSSLRKELNHYLRKEHDRPPRT